MRDCRSFCSLRSVSQRVLRSNQWPTHFWMCSSNSLILSVFCTFRGFGFLTITAGGFNSSRENQLESSELLENSRSSSSCITRAVKFPVSIFLMQAHSIHIPAKRALWSSEFEAPDGLSPSARVAHQIKSWRILRGSGRPSSAMCL